MEGSEKRGGVLHYVWIGTILVLAVVTLVFHWPGKGHVSGESPTPPPERLSSWPGRGPVRVTTEWRSRRDEFWKLRTSERGSVALAGDSITRFWGATPADLPGLKVANRGISGDTSRGLLFRFKEDVLDLEPRAVVILIGTNDLALGGSPDDVAANVGAMLDLCAKRPGMPVILCELMPRDREEGRFPEKIRETNAKLRELADARRVTLCETFAAMANEAGDARREFFPDGLHPGAMGYEAWAKPLRAALKTAGIE